MESSLYNKLEAASAANEESAKQDAIVNKINELSTMRMSMFKSGWNVQVNARRVAQSRIDLGDQLTVTGVMEQEMNNAKKNLNLIQSNKDNKMRMVDVPTMHLSTGTI